MTDRSGGERDALNHPASTACRAGNLAARDDSSL
jgi:hypothetical protein